MDPVNVTLVAGWITLLGGVLSGMALGLCFHREDWLGGYASFPRRMLRLGHISFFGLGFLNLLFAFSVRMAPLPHAVGQLVAGALVLGALTMPLVCFLTAWKARLRQLFPIPVACVLIGVASLLAGWSLQ